MGMDVEALERKRKWAAVCGMADLERYLAELQRARQELAELRAELGDRYTIEPRWEDPDAPDDGRLRPDYYRLVDPDGNDVDIEVDGSELVDWVIDRALRQQAAAACKRIELSDPLGVELGAVLALIDLELIVTRSKRPGDPWYAGFWRGDEQAAEGSGVNHEAAILAAARKLLGLTEDELRRGVSGSPADAVRAAINLVDEWRRDDRDPDNCEGHTPMEQALIDAVERLRASTAAEPRRTCETCARWSEGEPARSLTSMARWCTMVEGYRQPDAWCDDHSATTADTDPAPGSDEQLPGVSVEGNVVRSEGDGDV